MDDVFYWSVFAVFALQAAALVAKEGVAAARSDAGQAPLRKFRLSYLAVYSLQMRELAAANRRALVMH